MFNCNDKETKCLCEQLVCCAKETPKGIQIEITTKDPSKADAFKALVKSLHDFCKDDPCCKCD